jgi:hypothetical protein
MKNLFLLFTLISAFSFGQEASIKETKAIYPLYIIDGIISNEAQIKLVNSNEISTVSIYKSDNLPKNRIAFSNFIDDGIIDIILKVKNEKLVAVSLKSLNLKNHLEELNPVYINRILVKDNAVQIFEDIILETEIITIKNQQFLNIWTISKEERNRISRSEKVSNPLKKITLK